MVELGGGITCLVAGLGFLLLSFGMGNAERHRRSTGVLVPGFVVGSETVRTRGGTYYEAALIEFRDDSGQVRRFRRTSGTTARPKNGTPVQVRFDPLHPDAEPSVEGDQLTAVLRVVFAVAGAVAAAVGVALLGPVVGAW